MESITWTVKHFDDLTPRELHECLRLRSEVFAVEQNCVYCDPDSADLESHHLMGRMDGTLVAYVRVVRPSVKYEEPSIGRVVTSLSVRRTGLGKLLMSVAIEATNRLFPNQDIRISAQEYLLGFYSDLSFESIGESYIEDHIPHREMLWKWEAV